MRAVFSVVVVLITASFASAAVASGIVIDDVTVTQPTPGVDAWKIEVKGTVTLGTNDTFGGVNVSITNTDPEGKVSLFSWGLSQRLHKGNRRNSQPLPLQPRKETIAQTRCSCSTRLA